MPAPQVHCSRSQANPSTVSAGFCACPAVGLSITLSRGCQGACNPRHGGRFGGESASVAAAVRPPHGVWCSCCSQRKRPAPFPLLAIASRVQVPPPPGSGADCHRVPNRPQRPRFCRSLMWSSLGAAWRAPPPHTSCHCWRRACVVRWWSAGARGTAGAGGCCCHPGAQPPLHLCLLRASSKHFLFLALPSLF